MGAVTRKGNQEGQHGTALPMCTFPAYAREIKIPNFVPICPHKSQLDRVKVYLPCCV